MPPSDLARARLADRARRTTRIRRGVGAATLAAFALAWGVIAHDGAMGTTKATASTTASNTDRATSSSSTTADGSAPVTTAQS
jgi:hypothetical protein